MQRNTSKNYVTHFVDSVRELHGVDPPRQVKARVGVEAGKLVKEGIDPEFLWRGVEILAKRGMDPSMLSSAVFSAQTEPARKKKEEQREEHAADSKMIDAFLQENRETWPTGTRMVRGSHSATYVPDVLGFDTAPYPVEWPRPKRADVLKALKERVVERPRPPLPPPDYGEPLEKT